MAMMNIRAMGMRVGRRHVNMLMGMLMVEGDLSCMRVLMMAIVMCVSVRMHQQLMCVPVLMSLGEENPRTNS